MKLQETQQVDPGPFPAETGGREVIAASSASVKWMKEGFFLVQIIWTSAFQTSASLLGSSSSSWQPPQLHLAAHVV